MKTINRLIVLVFSFTIPLLTQAQSNYPGSNIIGMGYDVFGEFASNRSVMYYPLFDFSKMQTRNNANNHTLPKLIRVDNMSNHVVKTVEGNSESEYIKHLSREAGLSGDAFFFKGSVEQQFNQTASTSSASFYYTYIDINTKWRITLDTRNTDTLIAYLDPQFKMDLAKLAPKDFFETYGTHFITKAYLGGRIDYSTTTQMSGSVTETDLKTAISAKYMRISGNLNVDKKSEHILNQVQISDKLNVIGGNSEFTNNISDYEQYQRWAEGIMDKPVLSGFDEKSLKPIWILTKDEK